MPRDFGSWFNAQGLGETEEVDDTIWLHCPSCGKDECVSLPDETMWNFKTGQQVVDYLKEKVPA